jgi:hypothetical protein
MIRPFTFITMLLAAASGAYLFAVKHRAQVLDDQIAQVADESRQDAAKIIVLQAQWALETDPTRLQQLANRFTTLQPMKPAQLVTFATLQADLPPAGSAAPGSAATGAAPPIQVNGAGPVASVALPFPPAPAPVPSVAPPPVARLASVESLVHALRVGDQSELHLAAARNVEDMPPPRAFAAAPARARPAAPPRALYATSAPLVPIGARVVTINASSPPVQEGGSMLGMATEMPPGAQNGSAN